MLRRGLDVPSQRFPSAPVEHANEKHHRRLLAERANASLTVNGSVPMTRTTPKPYVSVSGAYTVDLNDYYIICTGGSYTVTLPTAAGNEAREFTIKNSGTGTITVDAFGSETIDDQLTQPFGPYTAIVVISNGTDWVII